MPAHRTGADDSDQDGQNDTEGIASLRAIPWQFAWTQVRLNLPAWLGIRQALEAGLAAAPATLRAMLREWPYFTSFTELIEMVLGKTDGTISAHYEAKHLFV